MKIVANKIVILLAVLFSANFVFAREWRGLVPAHSTRSDVIRLFNQCSDQKEACVFTTAQEDVYILFAGGLSGEFSECGRSLTPETVMFIEVRPHKPLKFSSLRLAKDTYNSFDFPAFGRRDLKGYRTFDGLLVSTVRDKVFQLDYLADSNSPRVCSEYYRDSEAFIIQPGMVHPPAVIDFDYPASGVKPGERFFLSGIFLPIRRGLEWTVTGGQIISGQQTDRILVEATALAGQKIRVTAQFQDSFGHGVVSSTEIPVHN